MRPRVESFHITFLIRYRLQKKKIQLGVELTWKCNCVWERLCYYWIADSKTLRSNNYNYSVSVKLNGAKI